MVTGVETAGLVVGSLPLVLKAVQTYVEGIAVGKRAKNYRKEIEILRNTLRIYVRIYENNLTFVLTGLVPEVDMAAYVANGRGDVWRKSVFESGLKLRLGSSYDIYLDTLNEINRLSKECRSQLGLDELGKVCSRDVDSQKCGLLTNAAAKHQTSFEHG